MQKNEKKILLKLVCFYRVVSLPAGIYSFHHHVALTYCQSNALNGKNKTCNIEDPVVETTKTFF